MSKAGRIKRIAPAYAVFGGEIEIEIEGFDPDSDHRWRCFIAGIQCRIVAASAERLLVISPDADEGGEVAVRIEAGPKHAESVITIGAPLADDMHLVANPAVDPKDDAIILTRSGSRGRQLEHTLYRLEPDGYLDELPVEIMNPTGIAFSPAGDLYVTNRAEGTVSRIDRGEEAVVYATALGIATGIAFDKDGVMYVGDRSGTVYRIPEPAVAEPFAHLEPSVSAYHIAFGPDGRLFVSAPGFASSDSVFAIDTEGSVEKYSTGFGRPQGIAFDTDGNLYIAACHAGKRGIFRIASDTPEPEFFAAGANVVGLCFTRTGDLIAATNDSVYSLPAGIKGTLLK